MVICKFWDAGNCRFGQNCRFEHPNTNRAQTSNRFSAFNNLSSGGGFGNGSSDNGSNTYSITKETIEKDLTTERPQWILSAYGPGRDAPEQLFGGSAREQSFEEMRLHHVLAASKGSPQQALNEAQQLYQQAEQQIQTTVGNLDGAIQFIIGAGNNHPNRIDICKQNTLPGGTTGEFLKGNRAQSSFSQASPFRSNSGTNSSNPFSSSAQSSSAFGGNTPSSNTSNPFGQAHNSGASTFGQPSSTSAFGQPNALGQKPSPFATANYFSIWKASVWPAGSTYSSFQPARPAPDDISVRTGVSIRPKAQPIWGTSVRAGVAASGRLRCFWSDEHIRTEAESIWEPKYVKSIRRGGEQLQLEHHGKSIWRHCQASKSFRRTEPARCFAFRRTIPNCCV
ncbi:hypothetical protein VD0001_g5815 [Verticillium dahliae]|nr:hypothetical protein VD0001_g5815 [Verticillium dahliae]